MMKLVREEESIDEDMLRNWICSCKVIAGFEKGNNTTRCA